MEEKVVANPDQDFENINLEEFCNMTKNDDEPFPKYIYLHGDFFDDTRGCKYPCSNCFELFPTKLSLHTHIKMHLRPYCPICFILMDLESEIEQHMNCHFAPLANSSDSMQCYDPSDLDIIDEVISEDSGILTVLEPNLPKSSSSSPNSSRNAIKVLQKRPKKTPKRLENPALPKPVTTTRFGRKVTVKQPDY